MTDTDTTKAAELLPSDEEVDAVGLVLCRTGKFETGQGTCAPICMSQLGNVRKKGCAYAKEVYRELVTAALIASADVRRTSDGASNGEVKALAEAFAWLADKVIERQGMTDAEIVSCLANHPLVKRAHKQPFGQFAPPSQARTSDGGDGAVAVQDEWVLVPVEPTEAMARASRLIINLPDNVRAARVTEWGVKSWSAMLAAAPPAPIPTAPDETNERLRKENTDLRNSLSKFTKHYEPWMLNHPRETQSSTFSRHTFADLIDALDLLNSASSSKEGGL